MQRLYQPMRGEKKYSVPNVCPQCQTVVTKKTAQDRRSRRLVCRVLGTITAAGTEHQHRGKVTGDLGS